ncbi:MAG: methyltransferase [Bacteroidetes bacterium]|nr:methyltransferase [Bacteroidota bacterium]
MSEDIHFHSLPPVWFIRMVNRFRHCLISLSDHLFPASVVLYEQFQVYWLLPCIKVAAELDIAGILKKGPKTLDEIVSMTGTHRESLFRMMRALCSQGIFRKQKDGRFVNTRKSKALTQGKNSIRYMLLHHLGTINWIPLGDLSYSVRTGKNTFSRIYGKGIYDFLSDHPSESALFDKSMTNLTNLAIEPILSACDFSKNKIIADIGGGEGLLLSSILHKHTHLRGLLNDLPEALKNAETTIAKYNVSERVTITPGNFFESVPSGADVYILKNIIHNWNDEKAVVILSNIKKALPVDGKILLIEMIIEEDNSPSFGKLIDIQMMTFFDGAKERTLEEFRRIIADSGLRVNRIIPTIAPVSIIEMTHPK